MRQIRLNLALGASLIIFAGASAAGQEPAPAPQEQIEQPTEASVEPQAGPTPEPAPAAPRPVPQTLDALIPQSATEDAESWAAQGADEVAGPVVAVEFPADEALDPSDPLFDIDGAINSIAIPTPEPLTPDPDRPSFADIAAPDLIDLPQLADVEVSDELTLAFPAEAGLFPEQDEYVARFRALSAIEALESDDDTVPQLAARARSDEALLSQMLRTYGYYDGEVVHQLSGGRRGFANGEENEPERDVDNSPSVRFDVIPSVRYSFGKVDLGPLDELGAPDGKDLRDVFGIKPGDPLYADRVITQQAQLRLALGETGYPFTTMDEPDLLIDHARQEGDLTLRVDPNGKYEFAVIASSDPAFLSNRHLQRIARFDPGDTYATSLQSDLRRAILATGLVSSVVITPRETVAPSDDQPGQLALDVEMERAPLRTISGAIGFGSEDGIKVEAGWEHRNLFPPEGALRLRGIVGTKEQLASVTYRRNNFRDRDQILTIDAYASDIETDAVDARTVALRGAFERVSNLLFQKPLSWSVGAEVLYTDERNRLIGGIERPRQTYLIGALFGSATLDSSDDLLDPSEGFRLTGFLGPEVSRSIGTETFYLRAQVDGSMYHDVGAAVIAGRVRLATIQGAEAFEIAPSRRLYSGGGGSVRGYGYQAIGPLNDFGEPTGGASQVEVGVEARIQTGFLDGAVEVVPFFDAGSVSLGSTPDFRFVKYGAGVGIRYKTTFGPIRADLGVPLNPGPFDAPVVLYVSLGQAF